MSYQWVMKYLPDKYKERPQKHEFLTQCSKVPRRRTGILDELLRPPKREGALKIKKYANTDFVSLLLERGFYEKFERDSLELGVSTELSALKALEDYHEKMKRAITLKNKNKASGGGENHRT